VERSKLKLQESFNEKAEIEEIMRKLRNDADEAKKKAAEMEFSLREAKYEVTQWTNKYSRLESEKDHQDAVYKTQIQDNQSKIESLLRQTDEKFQVISHESEKVSKLFETLLRSSEFSHSQTNQHILSKTKGIINKIRQIALSTDFNPQEHRHKLMNNNNSPPDLQVILF
jgi:dsDNA-specific endonuclease/ATPase MutS2